MSNRLPDDRTGSRPRTVDGVSSRRRPITDDETASEAVISAVANAADAEVTALPPLGDHCDVESLDRLLEFESGGVAPGLVFTRTEEIPTRVEISFSYAGFDVTVTESYVVVR